MLRNHTGDDREHQGAVEITRDVHRDALVRPELLRDFVEGCTGHFGSQCNVLLHCCGGTTVPQCVAVDDSSHVTVRDEVPARRTTVFHWARDKSLFDYFHRIRSASTALRRYLSPSVA